MTWRKSQGHGCILLKPLTATPKDQKVRSLINRKLRVTDDLSQTRGPHEAQGPCLLPLPAEAKRRRRTLHRSNGLNNYAIHIQKVLENFAWAATLPGQAEKAQGGFKGSQISQLAAGWWNTQLKLQGTIVRRKKERIWRQQQERIGWSAELRGCGWKAEKT